MTAEAQQYLSPGSQVGAYTLDSDPEAYLLGVGSFGIVYRCSQTTSGADCVLKEYFPFGHVTRDSSTDAVLPFSGSGPIFSEGLAEFEQEASRLAEFSEERTIVDCVEFVGVNGTGYLVMPWVSGETLQDKVGRDGPIPANQLQKIMLDLLAALKAIHEPGYVHRDIKPSNIWLPQQGGAMVLDFGGLSEVYQQEKGSRSGLFSEGFSPWEQYARLSEKVGPWSDIYSLGASMYFAMSGDAPADAISRVPGLTQPEEDPMVLVQSEFSDTYGLRWCQVIDDMLLVRPRQRPATACQVTRALRVPKRGKHRKRLPAGHIFRDKLSDDSDGLELVVVPPGRFWMGDLSMVCHLDRRRWTGDRVAQRMGMEGVPVREVCIERPFAISKFPVTNSQFNQSIPQLLPGANSEQRGELDKWCNNWDAEKKDNPVRTSWWLAQLYADWLSAETGDVYRLPSEAEWEYAARAGSETRFWWGDRQDPRFYFFDRSFFEPDNRNRWWTLDTYGPLWSAIESRRLRKIERLFWSHAEAWWQKWNVGNFPANPFGVSDLGLNFECEWCDDIWHDSLRGAPQTSAAWCTSGNRSRRVTRVHDLDKRDDGYVDRELANSRDSSWDYRGTDSVFRGVEAHIRLVRDL